jgi:hypothetical protein
MANLQTTENQTEDFNIRLGRLLFSDPLREPDKAVVVANHQDIKPVVTTLIELNTETLETLTT